MLKQRDKTKIGHVRIWFLYVNTVWVQLTSKLEYTIESRGSFNNNEFLYSCFELVISFFFSFVSISYSSRNIRASEQVIVVMICGAFGLFLTKFWGEKIRNHRLSMVHLLLLSKNNHKQHSSLPKFRGRRKTWNSVRARLILELISENH